MIQTITIHTSEDDIVTAATDADGSVKVHIANAEGISIIILFGPRQAARIRESRVFTP